MKNCVTYAIDQFPWDKGGYKPECFACLSRAEDGLHLSLRARQTDPRREIRQYGGLVCTDDCLEFFLAPIKGKALYFNFETNADGIYHLGLGEGRHGRAVFHEPAENVLVTPVTEDGFWGVDVVFENAFFLRWFGACPGKEMRGNFYKCGDATARPHWGMWTAYDLPAPDFHRPELFKEIIL